MYTFSSTVFTKRNNFGTAFAILDNEFLLKLGHLLNEEFASREQIISFKELRRETKIEMAELFPLKVYIFTLKTCYDVSLDLPL